MPGFPASALRMDPTTVNTQWGAQHDCMLDSTVYLSGSDMNNKAPQQWYSTEYLMMSAVNGTTVSHIAVFDAGVTDIDVGFNHAHDQVHGILFHGSASCVHGKRCWRSPELVHLVKRRKKCSCDRWSVRLTRVTFWMSWESGPALKDFLAPPSFAPSCSPSSATWSKQRRWATPVPSRAETPEARHRLGQLFETASWFGSPTTRRERVTSARRATTQGPIK